MTRILAAITRHRRKSILFATVPSTGEVWASGVWAANVFAASFWRGDNA